jgi:TonB family protein
LKVVAGKSFPKRREKRLTGPAKAAGAQGIVILHAIIGMNGSPLSLRVMNTEIDPELARAAVEAVSKWRYSSTLLNGEPIEVDTTIKVNFTCCRRRPGGNVASQRPLLRFSVGAGSFVAKCARTKMELHSVRVADC